jgi:8-oxo-dGTP pyrophosphatase MutT (NUDIX family)
MSAVVSLAGLSPDGLLERLHQRLLPLGGTPDQGSGAAPFSDFDLHAGARPAAPQLKEAGVLMALVPRPQGLGLILTRRTDTMPTHAGQIALPGGRRQGEDASLVETALREAREEVGLDPLLVRPIGLADAYETVSGYRITPVVGLVEGGEPQLRADPREVAEVFEAPFGFFLDPANHVLEERMWNGMARRYYAMPWEGRYVWGATAGMLRALWLRLGAG